MARNADRHDHSRQHLTDVHTRRVSASAGDDYVAFAWDYPGSTLLEVRILRSEQHCARSAADGEAQGQHEVYHDVTGSFRDTGLLPDRAYYYAVFARHPGEEWVLWQQYERPSVADQRSGWREFLRILAPGDRARIVRVAAAVLCVAAAAALPGRAAAADSGTAPTGGKAAAAATQALGIAKADPTVAAALAGSSWTVSTTLWGGSAEQPDGAGLVFRWPASSARSVDAVWPLLASVENGVPVPPYDSVEQRLRLQKVSAVQVDVLLQGTPSVLQIMPRDAATQYTVQEETWPPFSWLPWFTRRPWVVAPLFLIVGLIVAARAWLRSRAWNRRLPSMTRHDRQFIGRLSVIVFLLAGLFWQVFVAWYAAHAPTLEASGLNAGELVALPSLLIPPGLFVAGLVLELSSGSHRVAWGLLALLALAASAYNLATAVTGPTTNLNLSYYLLLGVLCLLAIPRAFSAGKMGWSRSTPPHEA